MKALALFIVVLTGSLLMYGMEYIPGWGDPFSLPSTHVSPRYIEKSMEETGTPNMVTSVLADYRSYDTLGEVTVIFTAGVACLLLLLKDDA